MPNTSHSLINTKTLIIPVALTVLLILSSQISFLFFHVLAESFAIFVAILAAVVVWQMYDFTRNHFLMYLGCGYFWIASLDLLHAFSYKGMSIFTLSSPDMGIQIWIGTRYMEAFLLLSAPWFLSHSLRRNLVFSLFAIFAAAFMMLVISGNFPITFIEGKGLTEFKIYSEYIIICIIAAGIIYLNQQRQLMDQRVFKLMIASMALTMMAELAFTFYISVYGLSNITGHIFKLFSFWLIFVAVVRTTLREPFSALSKAETFYDAVPDATIIIDSQGIIQHVNKATCSLANKTTVELIGEHNHSVFHREDVSQTDCPLCHAISEGYEISAYELKINDALWCDFSTSPILDEDSTVIVIRDITDKNNTAAALKKSETQLGTLIETLPDLVWLKDPEGIYLSCNLKFERFFGAKEKEIVGKTDYDFLYKELADSFRKNDKITIATGKPRTNEEEIVYADDGHKELVETIKTPMFDTNGKLIGVLGIARDITDRKKMEIELQENENNLVRAQKMSKMGNWKLIPETHEVTASNEVLNIFELDGNNLTLEDFTNVIHPDDHEYGLNYIQDSINHCTPWDIENRLLLKDGSIKWVHIIGVPTLDNTGKITSIVGIAQDITERKRNDEIMKNIASGVSAQTGEAFFESLTIHLAKIFNVEYVITGVLDVNKDNKVNTIAVCIDGEISDNFSYDLEGTPCSHVVNGTSDSIRSYSSRIQTLFPNDKMLVDMDAESYVGVPLIDTTGKHIGLILIIGKKPIEHVRRVESILQIFAVRTVAEMQRMKSLETLEKSSKEWSFAMDFFDDAVYLIDLDDKLVRANRTFYQMTGLSPERAVGKDITSIIHPDGEDVPCPVCKARTERRDEVIIMEADHPDNPAGRPIQISVQVIRDKKGAPLSILMGIHDLTNTRATEEESAKLQRQLHQSQKMDALGKLTGGIAHDYNNMLGVIMGYADLLQDALNENPRLAKYACEIHNAGDRGAKLTSKLLSFSRQAASEASRTDLNALLQTQQHMLEKTLTVRIKLVLDLAENLWATWINNSEIVDVILNMSINSMHAIECNGLLTIQTSNKLLDHLTASTLGIQPGDYVLLSVTDTGCGMDEEIREKIFEPFFSTKGDRGTGLGLSQVYGFVHSSGGAIQVDSAPGQGTQFSLYFPRYHDIENKEHSPEEGNTVDIKGTETILVVDDESALLSLNCEILSQHGFNVLSAESAKQALEILKRERVALLLSDIIMPEMDGYQLSAIVKEKYPETKIQLMSGFSNNQNIDMVDEKLQQNVLFKPFKSQALLQRIRELLNE